MNFIMKKFFYQIQWNWLTSGLALGFVFLLAVALVKPIGVSTQFVILDGIIWDLFSNDLIVENTESKSGFSSSNAYLDKSGGKYAKNISNPINYSFIFVLAMIAGGFIGSRLQPLSSTKDDEQAPLNQPSNKRYLTAFFGGVLILFGARLAGGCTSGHMMSGIMQTSLSGYLFAIAAFAAAIPMAIFLYSRGQ